jgi:hypothetical protein
MASYAPGYSSLTGSTRMIGGAATAPKQTLLQMLKENLPVSPDIGASKYFQERWTALTNLNEIRLTQIFEVIQYGLLYLGSSFIVAVSIDYLFPKYDTEKSTRGIIGEIILQVIVLLIVVFYMRKLVKLVPMLFVVNFDFDGDGRIPTYRPYESTEYMGDLVMYLVFIAVQRNLLFKITEVGDRANTWLDAHYKKLQ